MSNHLCHSTKNWSMKVEEVRQKMISSNGLENNQKDKEKKRKIGKTGWLSLRVSSIPCGSLSYCWFPSLLAFRFTLVFALLFSLYVFAASKFFFFNFGRCCRQKCGGISVLQQPIDGLNDIFVRIGKCVYVKYWFLLLYFC